MTKPQIGKIANIVLPLLLGVFLVYYAYNKFSPEQIEEMKGYFKNANYNYIILSSIFSIISLASRAYRWNFSLEFLGYKSKFTTNFMAISIGYLLNLTLPRSGEFSRALILQKYEKVPFDKGFGTIISERVIDLICLLLCVVIALVFQYDILKQFLLEKIPVKQLIVLGVIGLFLFLLVVVLFRYAKWKFILLIKKKVGGLIEGVSSIYKLPKRGAFLFHTLIIWSTYILTFYFGIFALTATSDMDLGMVMSSFVAGSFAVTFTNGGFGAFPLIVSELLLFYHIPQTAGTAFGWILWTSQTALVVILGALSFLFLPLIYKKVTSN
ncbi:lysylphosphatidylglycerol synthase transmembrane domain-containing protein [Flavobacterium sp. NKUCC04_CG]|uniref:lysylphosphatidylglycerol synthase transmembrane domain-containing protein n=1 Tax=Flavobacterium sp. NKUCC04_CG TaxID=2842121 RepID=UPI001C5A5B17|nr:lysylphosphatidylglycerol synthase transmembrane domain-containing protein [Flavobacterium sp. NKUCC04_CG]MBW3519913.1 flippase-like domain-containing protein [Flavobacterium sp. NKUCC04_CG]